MTALADLQRDFLEELFGEGAPARDGIAIYRRNVLANLHEALAATYPVVRRLVGVPFFREVSDRFARAHPSTSGDLNLYGGELARFLASYPFAHDLPYLADVARLEWACHESFHAAEAPAFDMSALAAVPAQRHGGIRFLFHPAVRLFASPHPVMSIWEANQPDRDGTPATCEGEEHVIVRREEHEVRLGRMDPAQWACVAALARGETLEDAVDAAQCPSGNFLAPLLARLVREGAIAAIVAPECGA